MRRILVTGANGDIAEAVARILREVLPGSYLAGTDAHGYWPGSFFFDRVIGLLPASRPEFPRSLSEVARDFDLVIPTTEPELDRLTRENVDGLDTPILRLPNRLVSLFLDKFEASLFFTNHDLPAPRTTRLDDWPTYPYPFCVKPVRGAGGKGFKIINNETEAQMLAGWDPDVWLAQEYVPGEGNEYTCAVFSWLGATSYVILKRELQGGRTVRAEVCDVPEIASLLEDIVRVTDLEGCLNVQLKLTPSGPLVLEINPRMSSTVRMRHLVGFRDCEWWVKSFLGMSFDPPEPPAVGSVVYRTSEERVFPGR